ncbi:MAG: MoaD/ThiS family protein [Candidatus Hodarchaeales archaeon]|jgi:molybdopterin converting factor small subunit
MKIRVQLFGKLGVNLGSEVELELLNENPTIRDVISLLIEKDPSLNLVLLKHDEISQGTILLINGHGVNRSTTGLDTLLVSKDRITIDRIGFLEIVGGG